MLVVPLNAVPNQQTQVQLGNQAVSLEIAQSAYGLFMSVTSNDTLIVSNVICQNLNRIVRDLYLGFSGDFMWCDTEGTSDPDYTGVGGRYQLVWLSPSDLPPGVG